MRAPFLVFGCMLMGAGMALPWDAALPPASSASHWAFRPIVRPQLPAIHGHANNDIDRFILASLEAKGLRLNSGADRPTLIRRISFDLTGLPPTLAEIETFLNDTAPQAYERMVDRYLASPHYGERWGKYWLDAAGYADSNGYFSADSDRPLAWRYRDYVIRAFNQDKPYDRFVMEQLAGDELAGYVPDGDVTPAMAELLTATHFLRNAPDGTGESDGNPEEVRTDRMTVLEGTVQIAMNSLLGLTIQCARCHRHKFEPITHAEYYALQAIFFPAYNPDKWKAPKDRVVAVGSKVERVAWQRRTEIIDRQIKELRESLTPVALSLREELLEERLQHLETGLRQPLIQAALVPEKKRTNEQANLIKKFAKETQISDEDLAKRFPEFAGLREQVSKAIAAREKERPPALPMLSVFVETDPNPPVHHVMRRGQHNQPDAEVQPGVPAALTTPSNRFVMEPRPAGCISTGRRTAFARWVTAPENPLFARVMVNRVWQHHFGTGIVATPDNLGQSGAKPSHPELLDYLADAFMKSGWSVKALHRLILTSATYRQSSATRQPAIRDPQSLDPDNRLLSRFPLRRLDAEALRDGLLHISGELDQRIGGPYVPTRQTKEGIVDIPESQDGARRRSVYLQQKRTQVPTLLQLFDAPTIVHTCSVRPSSTVPLQALSLLNSEFLRARARAFAERLAREAGADSSKRIDLAFRLACARPPTREEIDAGQQFQAAQAEVYAGGADCDQRVWTDLCQMILASNSFLYLE